MTKDQNDQLERIALALGYTVLSRSPAHYGNDWGRLELLDPATQAEFSWNPLTHSGDRYALIKKLKMFVDFTSKHSQAKVLLSGMGVHAVSFYRDDEVAEAQAIVNLAYKWAEDRLASDCTVA